MTLADRGWRRAFRARAAGSGFFFAFFAMGAIEDGTPVYRARPAGVTPVFRAGGAEVAPLCRPTAGARRIIDPRPGPPRPPRPLPLRPRPLRLRRRLRPRPLPRPRPRPRLLVFVGFAHLDGVVIELVVAFTTGRLVQLFEPGGHNLAFDDGSDLVPRTLGSCSGYPYLRRPAWQMPRHQRALDYTG